MNFEQLKTKPKVGNIVYGVAEHCPAHGNRNIKIRQRIVERLDEDGAWFQSTPEFEYYEFLFPTEKDALDFINNKNEIGIWI